MVVCILVDGVNNVQKQYRVLAIIPKTAKTIIGIFHNERCIFMDTIIHSSEKEDIDDQVLQRKKLILEHLKDAGINLSKLDAVSANGGLLRAVEGGTYRVNTEMKTDLYQNYNGKHASNLGGLLASMIAEGLNIPAFIVDPPVVDEMAAVARYSGLPKIERKSIFHALNHKAVARQVAKELHSSYMSVNLVVAHIGNGITIGAHQKGKVIDVNNGLHGDGPFSLERAGTIPSRALIEWCHTNKLSEDIIEEITYHGGLKAYLSVDGFPEVEEKIKQNDKKAKTVMKAMGYQIAKEIGAMAVVLQGEIDGIAITGEFAYSTFLIDYITEQVNWIADVFVYPGESDLQAINAGTLRVLKEEESVKDYHRFLNKGEELYDERL